MPSESDWHELIEAVYREISPRDDPGSITVHNVEIVDETTCEALVNPPGGAGAAGEIEAVEVDGTPVFVREIEGNLGTGDQRVKVKFGWE